MGSQSTKSIEVIQHLYQLQRGTALVLGDRKRQTASDLQTEKKKFIQQIMWS